MRELNPRAWSIDGQCWCTRVDHDGYKEEWSGIVPVLAPDNHSKRIGEFDDTNIIVEFPTGLKDKNGKEIYEGDIVKCGTLEGCPAGVIVYRTEDGCYEVDDPLHTFGGEHFGELYANRMEVIGNIHQNKELLEEEDAGN